jgi:hypothetical protein
MACVVVGTRVLRACRKTTRKLGVKVNDAAPLPAVLQSTERPLDPPRGQIAWSIATNGILGVAINPALILRKSVSDRIKSNHNST